ncbi:hypothetical protein Q8A67_021055 [Cirrhinus molitorella]|uniref:Uncharacterized protein n=1 Tax=Cirrhinus molitorella TaxID=172907 RepID=A0AA88PDM9_9TELE|nr:hypothetical protein Q8A67_021055 [Cirrhinus molitorella]
MYGQSPHPLPSSSSNKNHEAPWKNVCFVRHLRTCRVTWFTANSATVDFTIAGPGQEADDFSCCDACIMNQRAQWPTCDQQRCTLLWLGGALSSPLSRSTDSTQLRGRPASMGIHVAKSQSVSERRKPRLCSLPHQPSPLPKKELFIWA